MKWFRLAALALLLSAPAAARAASPDAPLAAPDPALVRGTLPNGLRYAILPNRTPRQQVSIRMQVDAGAALETDAERGAAHFVEHMAFDGSRRFPDNSAEARFAAAGIGAGRDQNAFTDATGVLYVFDIPQSTPAKLDLAFDWMRDVGDALTFDPAQVRREKGVVLQELAVRRTGSTEVGEAISRFTAPGLLAARRSPGGTVESVTALDAPTLRAFHDRWYRPERVLLVIVGDVDAREMRDRVLRTFGDWRAAAPAPAEPAKGAVDPARALATLAVTTPNFAQGVVQACRVAPRDPALAPGREAWAREAADAMWLGAVRLRLRRLQRAADAPFTSANASSSTLYRQADYTCLSASPKAGRWGESLDVLQGEARRLDRFGLTAAEAARTRADITAQVETAQAQGDTRDSRSLAAQLLGAEIEGVAFTTPAEAARTFALAEPSLTAETAAAAFRARWDRPGGPTLVVLSTTPVTTDAVHAAWSAAAARPDPAPPVDEPATPWPYTDFGPPGAVTRRETVADFGFDRIAFANGLRLNFKRTPYSRNRVDVRVSFGAGQGELSADRQVAAMAAVGTLAEGGLGRLDADGVGRALQGRIWNASMSIGRTDFTLAGWTRPADLLPELQLLSAFLTDPGFRPEEALPIPSLADSYDKSNRIEPLRTAEVALNAVLPRPHVFDPPTRAQFAALTAPDLAAALKPPVTEAALEVTVVGDVDEAAVVSALSRTLGAIPARSPAPRRRADAAVGRYPAGGDRVIRTTHEGLKDKAAVYVVWPLFVWEPSRQREARALTLLREVLGDQVREEVRERLGATYTPSAGLSLDRGGDQGALSVAVNTSPAEVDRVAAAVRAVAGRLAAPGGLTPAMLEKVRKPLLEETARRKEGNGWWLQVLDGSWGYPYKLQQQRSWERDYATIPASEVAAAAARWIAAEPFVVISTPAPTAPAAAAVAPASAPTAPSPTGPTNPPATPGPALPPSPGAPPGAPPTASPTAPPVTSPVPPTPTPTPAPPGVAPAAPASPAPTPATPAGDRP